MSTLGLSRVMTRAALFCAFAATAHAASAAPTVSRLTPPSELFASGNPNPPVIGRFLPGQRFDLQATVRLDAGTTLKDFAFSSTACRRGPRPAPRAWSRPASRCRKT